MRVHIYNEDFIYYDNNKKIIFGKNHFIILKTFLDKRNLIDTTNYLMRLKNIDIIYKEKLYHNIEKVIKYFENTMNISLNEVKDLIVTGEYKKFYPRVLNIELCDYCNFYCGHCYKNAGNKNRTFLDFNIIKDICRIYKNKIQIIHLTGGEPLTHPHINQIIEVLKKSGFIVNITTNGSNYKLLKNHIIDMVNDFQISIYGYNNESYKLVTGASKFIEVKNFINYLESIDKKYNIGFMINRTYLNNNEEYNRFLNSLNFNKLIVSFAQVTGRLSMENNFWILTKKEKDKIINEYLPKLIKFEKNKNTLCDNQACTAGTLSYSLDENGNLGLCQVLGSKNYSFGDIYSIEDRAINNKFNIIEELNNTQLKKAINPMCKFYFMENK